MNLAEWLKKNEASFGSPYETLFVRTVLPRVPDLHFDAISVQYPFEDADRRQRYCDFVIQEDGGVRIAIEIDGYDKRGAGTGMSHADFIDWQRRHAALTSQGWYVLRFANRDVRDAPGRCAEHISLLLRMSRARSRDGALSAEEAARLDALTKAQYQKITVLSKEGAVMKYTIASFTALIVALVLLLVWQARGGANPRVEASPLVAATQVENSDTRPVSVLAGKETTCPEPLEWQDARGHLGESHAIVGPVTRVTHRANVRGRPTWIEIGAVYPDPSRLVLVVWGSNYADFPVLTKPGLIGKRVCVTGRIEAYKDVPQVELREKGQLTVLWD